MTAGTSQRKALTPDLLRAANDIDLSQNADVRSLFLKLVPELQDVLATLTPAPLRIAFDGLEEATTRPPADGFCLHANSQQGPLDIWLTCDRDFITGLAELCYGGTGKEPPADSSDRPASKLEIRLRQCVLGDVAAALPELIGNAFGLPVSIEPPPPSPVEPEAGPVPMVHGLLLFNVFSHSGELRITFPRQMLVKMLQAKSLLRTERADGGRTLARQLEQTTVELKFMLPQQAIALGDLGGLRPGHTIALAARPDDPILVLSEGIQLFTASLTESNRQIAFILREAAGGNPAAS